MEETGTLSLLLRVFSPFLLQLYHRLWSFSWEFFFFGDTCFDKIFSGGIPPLIALFKGHCPDLKLPRSN